jgi:hypothetical protein
MDEAVPCVPIWLTRLNLLISTHPLHSFFLPIYASKTYFAKQCFKDMKTSFNKSLLNNLLQVVNHPGYGPYAGRIIYQIAGVEPLSPVYLAIPN